MLKSIKVDSLEWYGYRLLKLIISHAESVGIHTQLKTVAKKAALTVVPNHWSGLITKQVLGMATKDHFNADITQTFRPMVVKTGAQQS